MTLTGPDQPHIAWLKPGALDRESLDVFAMTPKDVRLSVFTNTLATHRTNAARFDAEAFDRLARPQILKDLEGIAAYAKPGFTAVTGDLIQATMGVAWDRALRDDIARTTGTAGTTAMTALVDALTHVGARRVSVATPWQDEQNAIMRGYLEEAGFEVAVIAGYPVSGASIDAKKVLPREAPLDIGKQVFDADRTTQAIYIPSPVWAVGPHIEPLEEHCGIPVLAVMNTFLWRGLKELGHPGGVRGYGRMLERVGG